MLAGIQARVSKLVFGCSRTVAFAGPRSLFVTLLLSLAAGETRAQWDGDPAVNTPLCTFAGVQFNSVATSDGAGGVIVAWVDNRDPLSPGDIYAQHLDAAGLPLWDVDGVPICTAAEDQGNPAISGDGAGGAIITWQDARTEVATHDIYAQRITAAGAIFWPVDGVLVCAAAGEQIWPMLCENGAGGAIITWEDARLDGDYDIYAQHVDSLGLLLWSVGTLGLPVSILDPDPGFQLMPMLVSDLAGGAVITWYDLRAGDGGDIYAQHVTAGGALAWLPAGGVLICGAPGAQDQPTLASDGAGGAIVTWIDGRPGGPPPVPTDIYAQHITAAGALPWPLPDGVPICAAAGVQEYPRIVSDLAAGAIITWHDSRSGAGSDIYAQRVNDLGTLLWPIPFAAPVGIPVCLAAGDQVFPKIVSDGDAGAIIAWSDERLPGDWNIHAQRMSTLGVPLWTPAGGIPVSTPAGDQTWAFQFVPMVADGSGGAIVTWTDGRPPAPPPATDIHAQLIGAGGELGLPTYVDRVVDGDSELGVTSYGRAVAAAGSSGSAVAGSRLAGSGGGVLVSRFTAGGSLLWSRSYDVSPFTSEFGSAIARMPDGWVIAGHTGATDSPSGSPSPDRAAMVMRLDESGDVLWAGTGEAPSEARSVIGTASGDIVVAGHTQVTIDGVDRPRAFVTRLTGGGAHVWTAVVGAPPAFVTTAWGLTETSDGGLVIAGNHMVTGSVGILLTKLDADGAVIWSQAATIDAIPLGSPPVALAPTPAGGFAVQTGWEAGPGSSNRCVVSFDSTGVPQWATRVELADEFLSEPGGGIAAGGAGYFVCGSSSGVGPQSAIVLRLDAGGVFQWMRRLTDPVAGAMATSVSAVAGGALVVGSMGNDLLLQRINLDGEACLVTSVTPTVASPEIVVVDAGLTSTMVTPTITAQSPSDVTLAGTVLLCVANTAVEPAFEERVSSNAIKVRVANPMSGTLNCRITLPRALPLRGRWYDVAGRSIGPRLLLGELEAGPNELRLAAPGTASGVYLLAVEGGGLRGTAMVVVQR